MWFATLEQHNYNIIWNVTISYIPYIYIYQSCSPCAVPFMWGFAPINLIGNCLLIGERSLMEYSYTISSYPIQAVKEMASEHTMAITIFELATAY